MESSDPGAAEAPQLAEGCQRRQHALPHRAPDTRDEHDTTLSEGGSMFLSEKKVFILKNPPLNLSSHNDCVSRGNER